MKKSHFITESTLAIVPAGLRQSRIIEKNRDYLINISPKSIIKSQCLNDGTSFEIRQKLSEKLIGVTYKVPILINDSDQLIFFPTESPRQKSCSWLNYKEIRTFKENYNHNTVIVFMNGKRIELPVSYNIINNQNLKANYLNFKLYSN